MVYQVYCSKKEVGRWVLDGWSHPYVLVQARWFALHVIANVWISLLCLPDFIYMLTDPLGSVVVQ